jgi:hypothetical protein
MSKTTSIVENEPAAAVLGVRMSPGTVYLLHDHTIEHLV